MKLRFIGEREGLPSDLLKLIERAEKETAKKVVDHKPKKEDEQPKDRYFFGDDNDFQLQQALRHLKGEKLLEVKISNK